MITEAQIEAAYSYKAEALESLWAVVNELEDEKNIRAGALAVAIENGLYAECKNDDQRKAAAKKALASFDERIADLERQERGERLRVDLANTTIGKLDMLLRLAELSK